MHTLAHSVGYGIIAAVISAVVLCAVCSSRSLSWLVKVLFLIVWGALPPIAIVYAWAVIYIPSGSIVAGVLASVLVIVGGLLPFWFLGLPELKRSFARAPGK